MKKLKSFSLLELIFSITILLSIAVISLDYTKNLYQLYNSKNSISIKELELKSLYYIFKNIFEKSLNIQINNNIINLTIIDEKNFLSENYYAIIDLNKSTKKELVAPSSSFENCNNKYLSFGDNEIYEIEKFENEKIVLKDYQSSIKVYEIFYLIESISKIYYENQKIYIDEKLLAEDITDYIVKKDMNLIEIKICKTNEICKTWKFSQ